MTVKDLIEKLQKVDGDCVVRLWSARDDAPADDVVVSVSESHRDEPVIVWVSDRYLGDYEQ